MFKGPSPVRSRRFHARKVSLVIPEARSISEVASLFSFGRRALTVSLPSRRYWKVTSTLVSAGRSGGRSRMTHFPISTASLPLASPPSTTLTATEAWLARCVTKRVLRVAGSRPVGRD
jgi:hypothetical protein